MGGQGSGRPRKPRQLKLLEGTLRADRDPVPFGIGGPAPEPPDFLSDLALTFWKENAPALIERNLLDALSASLFAALCCTWARMQDAHRVIEKEGFTVTGPRGAVRAHPAVRIHQQASRTFLRLAADFGMTPASRSRLGIQPPEVDSVWAKFDNPPRGSE